MRTQRQPSLRFIIATTAISLLMLFTPGFECEEAPILGPGGLYQRVEGGFYSLSFAPETVIIPTGSSENITFTFFTSDPVFFGKDGRPSFTARGLGFKIGNLPQGLEVLRVKDEAWESGTCRATYEISANGLTPGIYSVPVDARTLSADPNDPTPFNIYVERTLKVTVIPRGIVGTASATQLAGGAYHSLAILADGSVWSWGLNDKGQLGDGTTVSRLVPVPVQGLPGPAVAVAAGGGHSLALLADGTIWGWGDNRKGQLSRSEQREFLLPITTAGEERGAVAVAAGAAHSVLLTASGSILTRGANDLGQLGRRSDYRPPLEWHAPYEWHSVDLDIPRVFTVIAAGADSSFAIDDQGGVWGWGDNSARQLGATSPAHFLAPIPVGLFDATAIAAGISHVLALTTDGTVRALGGNRNGQLGIEGDGRRVPVTVPGLPEIVAIDAGFFHSMALGADGNVYAWGDGGFGQLAMLPGPPGMSIDGLSDVQAIAAGGRHSLCLMPGCGTVWAWGDNGAGQLGDGTGASSSKPVQVVGIGEAGASANCVVQLAVIVVGGGNVTSEPAGIDCDSSCSSSFIPGTVVTLMAEPAYGWSFDRWAGDVEDTDRTTSVLMDGSKI